MCGCFLCKNEIMPSILAVFAIVLEDILKNDTLYQRMMLDLFIKSKMSAALFFLSNNEWCAPSINWRFDRASKSTTGIMYIYLTETSHTSQVFIRPTLIFLG